jgi:hypothetical protein
VIHWILSHSKERGNKKVDKLAKEAALANGGLSTRINLPQILRKQFPTSVSATKQAYYRKMMNKWDIIWDKSERSRRINKIDNYFPFNGYR